MSARPAIDRVLERVVHEDRGHSSPCWIFTGSKNNYGYGQVGLKVNGRRTIRHTHRVVYLAKVGPIEGDLTLDHLCEVKACCNPAHLDPCTRLENIRRYRERHAEELAYCKYGHLLAETRKITSGGNSKCSACDTRRATEYYWRKKLSHRGTLFTPSAEENHASR